MNSKMNETNLSKKDLLDILCLLSAVESWGLAQQVLLPEFMHEQICHVLILLRKEILSE